MRKTFIFTKRHPYTTNMHLLSKFQYRTLKRSCFIAFYVTQFFEICVWQKSLGTFNTIFRTALLGLNSHLFTGFQLSGLNGLGGDSA